MKYAALIESQQYIEGDERSKSNPGHGYPAHTLHYTTFREFKDHTEMLEWVKREESLVYSRDKYKIIKYEELIVKSTISIEADVK